MQFQNNSPLETNIFEGDMNTAKKITTTASQHKKVYKPPSPQHMFLAP